VSANAIKEVSQALKERLDIALAGAIPGEVFVGPLDDIDSSGAPLILFLYRIVPNPSLRNREHAVASPTPAPPAVVFQNSLPLDLYFLLTVGTTAGPSEAGLLQALGLAMQDIQGTPELMVKDQVTRLSLEPLTTEEASRIWALFPTANYRTSIAYLASPVWIDPAQPETVAARVVEDQVNAGPRAGGLTL
jgi:hypothetical protein